MLYLSIKLIRQDMIKVKKMGIAEIIFLMIILCCLAGIGALAVISYAEAEEKTYREASCQVSGN